MAVKTRKKVKVTQYAWREGSRFTVPAQVAGEELGRIARENGGAIKPRDVVNESRPCDAPLHPVFEWDDEVAAELYRDDQARQVIRNVYVVEEAAGPNPQTRINYVVANRNDGRGRVYVDAAEAINDEELRRQVLTEAITALKGLKKRYEHLSELASVFEAIDRLDVA